MLKTRVAVLRGGPSFEYDISLETGSNVLRNIPEEYDGVDIFIDKSGVWHRSGLAVSPYQALKDADVVWNALHGSYGEGRVQQDIESIGLPYTGSVIFSSTLSMNKSLSKEYFKKSGLHVPESTVVSVDEDFGDRLFDVFQNYTLPIMVKPLSSSSSFGITLAKSFDEIERGVRKAFAYSPSTLVEEYIPGTEATVGVIKGLRGEDLYALAPVEIFPTEGPFFDYDAKYKGRAIQTSPGNFEKSDKIALMEMAKEVHRALGLGHYSRSDFIVSPGRGIFILEANSLPDFTPHSSFLKGLNTANISTGDFIRHILSLALQKS